jgi:LCP family protein required for cell wall assembly
MKTTLKRGIGRAADLNGDGGGNGALPPGVLTPMTRYRQPEPPGRTGGQWARRILGWIVIAIATVAAGLAGGEYLWAHDVVDHLNARSRDVVVAAKYLHYVQPGRPTTALVLGYDRRTYGPERGLPSRSDTIMLVRADPATHSISMLSFPRDLLVSIRCPGHPVVTDRINAAYEMCGPRGTLRTVEALTGVGVNYLVTVNFRGFRRIVDTLGGVWIDVDRKYYNENTPGNPATDYANIDLQPGYQRLTGKQALDFARFRHTDSDLYRIARQQIVVRALKEQFAHNFSLLGITKVVNALRDNVEIGRGGNKQLDLGTLKNYAYFAYRLPAGHFFNPRIGDLTGYNELSAPQSAIDDAVHQFLHPDVEAARKATAAALGEKLRTHKLKPSRVTVLVLNGTTTAGLAANTSYELAKRGYRTVTPANGALANAPTQDYYQSKVYYDASQPLAQRGARQLSSLLGSAAVQAMPPAIAPLANGAMDVIVLGQTYPGNLPAAPVDRTPKHQPPNVTPNPSLARPLLLRVRRRVPFRLEVPTLIERSSTLDYEEPMRFYKIKGDHGAVRLVFKTGANEYWGIEETDWADAPVLNERNFLRHFGHREFDLYYNGSNLHMVVLRDNGATYWVVNTLLDSLSNETMLAIARGLRPLPK